MCINSSSYVNSNWSYSPETVKLGCDLCDLDLWPWPFAWTLLWSLVITPENFMMIRWWEHNQKGVTDGRTDGKYHLYSYLVAAKNKRAPLLSNIKLYPSIASQITSFTIVYWTVYSDAYQRKHQSSASLAFVRGIHRGPVNSPHKWPVTWKMFPFDDIIMSQ